VLPLRKGEQDYFGVILTASLTLLAHTIGFSFAMAISRYDQRKNYGEAEANAIGTEYVRADLLPPADAARVRELLTKYLDQRVLFYETRDQRRLGEIEASTSQLQGGLCSAVKTVATTQPTPVVALACPLTSWDASELTQKCHHEACPPKFLATPVVTAKFSI
jgi:hypothetical protein